MARSDGIERQHDAPPITPTAGRAMLPPNFSNVLLSLRSRFTFATTSTSMITAEKTAKGPSATPSALGKRTDMLGLRVRTSITVAMLWG